MAILDADNLGSLQPTAHRHVADREHPIRD